MFGARFPYFNMQELNLDWILERISACPEIINAPAFVTEEVESIYVSIDSVDDKTPNGVSFILIGNDSTPFTKKGCCLVYKMDSDNKIVAIMTFADNIGFAVIVKYEGEWGGI